MGHLEETNWIINCREISDIYCYEYLNKGSKIFVHFFKEKLIPVTLYKEYSFDVIYILDLIDHRNEILIPSYLFIPIFEL